MAANLQQSEFYPQENSFDKRAPAATQMKRILLVDNQAHVLRVMKLTLDRNGYEVDTALSGDVALGMLRENMYDVLITDNGLVKMDGQQLIDTINEQFRSRAPAMFLVTDQDAANLETWSAQVDRTECMAKPISLRYLVGRLNELFGKYETA